jgi:hypothetical protein
MPGPDRRSHQERPIREAPRRSNCRGALIRSALQVADRLCVSVKTVETYKSRLMSKLGLTGRAALVRYALQRGLLEDQEQPGLTSLPRLAGLLCQEIPDTLPYKIALCLTRFRVFRARQPEPSYCKL